MKDFWQASLLWQEVKNVGCQTGEAQAQIPVSYTHLDVYKRQTQDFVTYQEHGTAIPHGGEDDQDQFIYAGTVYEAKGEVRAFYTGFNRNYLREGKTSQVLMQAKACSDDYATWKKTGVAVELTPQPGYDGRNWRDPFVIWDDDRKEYLLVLGTRKGDDPSKTLQTGRLVHFTSKDLEHWQFKGDFWAPGLYTMFEMPDIFKIGDWWYLVYSCLLYTSRRSGRRAG